MTYKISMALNVNCFFMFVLIKIGRAHVYSSHSQISYAVFCLKKKNEQRVGPRLLRVPDEQRVERRERRGDEPRSRRRDAAAERVRDRDRGGPDQRLERAKAHLA